MRHGESRAGRTQFWIRAAVLLSLIMALTGLSIPQPARAADPINVDCDVDDLIQNIKNAAFGAVLNLPGTCTYTLHEPIEGTDTGLPVITSWMELTIRGNGATIERSSDEDTPQFRLFEIARSGNFAGTLHLEDLTLANGYAGLSNGHENGGAILNEGTLTVTNSILIDNHAYRAGGAIRNGDFGTLTVTNSTFYDNTAENGGAIDNGGTATIIDSTLSNNGARSSGGAISNRNGAKLTVTSSTLSGNTTTLSNGGAILNVGTATVTNSTLSGNKPRWYGGAVYNQGSFASLTVRNSTLSGNNGNPGGTIYFASGAKATVSNSILAASQGGNCYVDNGSFTDGGYNLVTDDTCSLTSGTSEGDISLDALALGALANNGGPTQTIALGAGSIAIDAIPAGQCSVTTDQRGQPRPVGEGCDIGAYEEQVLATSLSAVAGAGTYGGTATLSATLQAGGEPLAGKPVTFTLNGADVGSTTTDATGVATLSDVALTGIGAGTHDEAVVASFAGDDEYLASSASGPLVVDKAAQTITDFNAPGSATYGDDPRTLAAEASSGLPVSFASTTTDVCTIAGDELTIVGAGTCTITANQAGDDNWEAAGEVTQSFTVAKAPLTITASSASIDFGDPIPTITPSYAGFVRQDTEASLDTPPTCSTTANDGSPVGVYPTTCVGAESPNYHITYVAGTLTIGEVTATVTLNPTPPVVVDRTTRRATLTLGSTVTVDQGDAQWALPVSYTLTPLSGGTALTCTDEHGTGGDTTTLYSACTLSGVPAGRYDLTVSLGGNYIGEATGTVVVVDPVTGFVTGGGMVQGGMLSFSASYYGTQLNGSISYQRTGGSRVILGTQRLTSFVRVGDTVYVEGEATLNGVSGHRVLLTAIDNPGLQRDQVQLQVWDRDGNLVESASFDLTSLQSGQVYIGPGL